jgi:hypothetical protein
MASDRLLLPAPRKIEDDQDAFGVLGVSPDAPAGEIKRAYLRLVRERHPDVNPSAQARREYEIINRAYAEVTRRGNLARLKLKCDVVELKALYAEFLHLYRRTKTLTGIRTDVREPGLQGVSKEQFGKMLRLGWAMTLECPVCKWRVECDRATGYGEVAEEHREIFERKVQTDGPSDERSGRKAIQQ